MNSNSISGSGSGVARRCGVSSDCRETAVVVVPPPELEATSSVADSLPAVAGKGESHDEFTSLEVLSEFSLVFITILFVTFFVMFILILFVVGRPAGSESCG